MLQGQRLQWDGVCCRDKGFAQEGTRVASFVTDGDFNVLTSADGRPFLMSTFVASKNDGMLQGQRQKLAKTQRKLVKVSTKSEILAMLSWSLLHLFHCKRRKYLPALKHRNRLKSDHQLTIRDNFFKASSSLHDFNKMLLFLLV